MTQKPTLVRWKTLLLMSVSGFLLFFTRNNISIAGKYIQEDFGFTTIELGWIFTAFAAAYAIFQLPGGIMSQKLGARKMITGMLILWAILTILTGFLPGLLFSGTTAVLAVLIAIRLLMGAGQAPFFSVTQGILVRWFPISNYGIAYGVDSFIGILGGAAVGPITVFLIAKFGWEVSFYISTPLLFVLAAFWWWYTRDRPEEHPHINESEVELINAAALVEATNTKEMHWMDVLKQRTILFVTLSYSCQSYITYFFYNWLFIYLIDKRGFSDVEGGFASMMPWISAAIASLLGGYFCDSMASRFGPQKVLKIICVGALFLVAGFMYWGAIVDNNYMAIFFLSLCFGFMQIAEIVYWQTIAILADEQSMVASGILNTGGNVMGFLAIPILAYLLESYGPISALASCSVLAMLAAFFWIFIDLSKQIGGKA